MTLEIAAGGDVIFAAFLPPPHFPSSYVPPTTPNKKSVRSFGPVMFNRLMRLSYCIRLPRRTHAPHMATASSSMAFTRQHPLPPSLTLLRFKLAMAAMMTKTRMMRQQHRHLAWEDEEGFSSHM